MMENELNRMLLLIKKQSENNDHRRMIDLYLKTQEKESCKMMVASGRMVDVTNLRPDDIDLDDIITSLCSMPRYAGHTGMLVDVGGDTRSVKKILTVGAHTIILCKILSQIQAPSAAVLRAATHDFTEAYIVDIPREFKNSPVMSAYRSLEMSMDRMILNEILTGSAGLHRMRQEPSVYVDLVLQSRGAALAGVFDKEICLCLEMPFLMNKKRSFGGGILAPSSEELHGMLQAMCYRCCIDFPDIAVDLGRMEDPGFLDNIMKHLLEDSFGAGEDELKGCLFSSLRDFLRDADKELCI